MYESIWQAAARHLSEARMKAEIAEFFQHSRWSSFDRLLVLANRIAQEMEEAGLADVRLIEFPADGRTSCSGWVLPKAYDVRAARLTEKVSGSPSRVLADYEKNPTSLMMYSEPTPPGGIEAEVVAADRMEDFTRDRISGRIVLTSGLGLGTSRAAMRHGALGLVSDHRGELRWIKEGPYLDETNEWHNYTIPPMDEPGKGFGFAITPVLGRDLRARLAAGQRVRVHALVETRHYDGVLPVLSGRWPGPSPEEIVITGHYDEYGADDNGSQIAVALESVRAVQAMVRAGEIRPLARTLRLLFPMEARGFNALVQRREEIQKIRLGLNIDTVGTDQNAATAFCTLAGSFLALPSFAEDFLAELLDRTRESSPLFRWQASEAELIDNIFGEPRIGAPTPSLYHFNGCHHLAIDTPERISGRMLLDMARVSATYAAFMAGAGLPEALWLAELSAERGERRIGDLAARGLRGETGSSSAEGLVRSIRALEERSRERVASARSWVPYAEIYGTAENLAREAHLLHGSLRLLPRDFFDHRAEALVERLAQARQEAECRLRSRAQELFQAEMRPAMEKPPPASRCVPVKDFNGFLGFEDLSPDERAFVQRDLGIGVGWGAPMWLQQALMLANGKRTAGEISCLLLEHGLGAPDLPTLERIFQFLARRRMVSFRKFVSQAEVHDALRQAGIAEGDVVLGHFALSQFGYLDGGADALIETLFRSLGPTGTLLVPTFTFSWIGHRPYDPARSPSQVGAVTDRFWRRPGVLRSAHPTHSFAASGPLAGYLLEGHDHTQSALSRRGPIGKLADFND
ncbi:MAG: AAC(3) family N-acetyltransferase, partial [Armatimonadetes bacterium]|nr:AAC(3) family N-acetyltransferase [Armatimonadota bacterium]